MVARPSLTRSYTGYATSWRGSSTASSSSAGLLLATRSEAKTTKLCWLWPLSSSGCDFADTP